MTVTTLMVQGGIQVITLMQVFNWFRSKSIGCILSGIEVASMAGFALQFVVGGFWENFPETP